MISILTTITVVSLVSLMILVFVCIGYVKLNKMQDKFPNYELLEAKRKFNYSKLNEKLKKRLRSLKKIRKDNLKSKEIPVETLVDETSSSMSQHETDKSILSKYKQSLKSSLDEPSNIYDRMMSDFLSADEQQADSPRALNEQQNERNERKNLKKDVRVSSFILNEKK